jgi:hypothetical protein
MLALLILLVTFVAGFSLGYATRAWRSHKHRTQQRMYAPYTAESCAITPGPGCRAFFNGDDARADLQDKLERARRLLQQVSDPITTESLKALVAELENRLRDLPEPAPRLAASRRRDQHG